VLGAGTMGHGIAQMAAMAGFEVFLRDVDEASLARGRQAIERNLAKGVQLGKVSAADREQALAHINTTVEMGDLKAADLIVEAAPENLDLKQSLLRESESLTAPHCIWASNTSSLSITEIARSAIRPQNVIGMHFFNPVHIMRLVEIVVGKATSDDTVAVVQQVAQKLRKEPIIVQDVPGFASSRLGVALGLEAMRMVEQGVASAKDIDTAMELGYNHPMGPLKLTDHVGLDIRLSIAEYLYRELGSEMFRPPELLRRMVQEGKLGKKTGTGFYDWTTPAEDRRTAYSS